MRVAISPVLEIVRLSLAGAGCPAVTDWAFSATGNRTSTCAVDPSARGMSAETDQRPELSNLRSVE